MGAEIENRNSWSLVLACLSRIDCVHNVGHRCTPLIYHLVQAILELLIFGLELALLHVDGLDELHGVFKLS